MEKCLKPHLLPRVSIAVNNEVEHGKSIVPVAKLVEKGADNNAGHTAEGHNVNDPVETVLGIFHGASHT